MSDKDAATVLEEAADLLLIHGRCVVDAHNRDGQFCVLGAIAEVEQPGWWELFGPDDYWLIANRRKDVAWAIQDAVKPGMGKLALSNISAWNDSTTDDFEVIDTLRLVAKDLRNGEAE